MSINAFTVTDATTGINTSPDPRTVDLPQTTATSSPRLFHPSCQGGEVGIVSCMRHSDSTTVSARAPVDHRALFSMRTNSTLSAVSTTPYLLVIVDGPKPRDTSPSTPIWTFQSNSLPRISGAKRPSDGAYQGNLMILIKLWIVALGLGCFRVPGWQQALGVRALL